MPALLQSTVGGLGRMPPGGQCFACGPADYETLIELRVIDADEAWLSPFHGRVTGSIGVHAYYQDDYEVLFELTEPIFRRFEGRPHCRASCTA